MLRSLSTRDVLAVSFILVGVCVAFVAISFFGYLAGVDWLTVVGAVAAAGCVLSSVTLVTSSKLRRPEGTSGASLPVLLAERTGLGQKLVLATRGGRHAA